MENIDLNFFPGQASAIRVSHSIAPPSDTQMDISAPPSVESPNAIPFTTPLALGYHQYSSPVFGPAPQFGIVEQGSILSRPPNYMYSNTSFTFMSAPPFRASSALGWPTFTGNHVGVGMADRSALPIQRLSSAKAHETSFFCSRDNPGITPTHPMHDPFLNHTSTPMPSQAEVQPPYLHHRAFYPYVNRKTRCNDQHHFQNPADLNRDLRPSIYERILSYARAQPTKYYKCNKCGKEFPTAMALGGHMSSHIKKRKAEDVLMQDIEAWNQARMVHAESSRIAGNVNIVFEGKEATKEDKNVASKSKELATEDTGSSEEDGALKYLALEEYKNE